MSNATANSVKRVRNDGLDPDIFGDAVFIAGGLGDPSVDQNFASQAFIYEVAAQTLDDALYSSTSISSISGPQASFDTLLWDAEPTNPEGMGPQTPAGTSPVSTEGPQTPGDDTDPTTPEGTGPQTPGGTETPSTEGTGPQTPGWETTPGTGTVTPPPGSLKAILLAGDSTPVATDPVTKAALLAAVAAAVGVADISAPAKPSQTSLAFNSELFGSSQLQPDGSSPGSLLVANADPLGLF